MLSVWWGSWLMVRRISGVARVQRSCEAFGEAHCACCSSTISNGQLKVIGDARLLCGGPEELTRWLAVHNLAMLVPYIPCLCIPEWNANYFLYLNRLRGSPVGEM